MKLPVKLLTAVAALALLVVGVVSVQNAGDTAQAAVTGVVDLTNRATTRTTDSSPPSGRTYIGSGKTLYATMIKGDPLTPENTILENSDILIVTVVDSEENNSETATQAGTNPSVDEGNSFTIIVPFGPGSTPILSTSGQIKVCTDAACTGATNVTGDFAVTFVNPGDEDSNGSVGLVNVSAGDPFDTTTIHIEFQTSQVDFFDIEISTPVLSGGDFADLTVVETGPSTGVFEGFVKLVDNEFSAGTFTSSIGDPAGDVCNDADDETDGCFTAEVSISDGLLLTARYADASNNSNSPQTITRNARVETSAPTPVISSPANGSATQNRTPGFSGTVSDTGSGLDVSEVTLYIDSDDDANNANPVLSDTLNVGDIDAITLGAGGADVLDQPLTLTGTPSDGVTTGSWTFTPNTLPNTTEVPTGPDNIVDFMVVAFDLAGNIGFSDSDTSTTGPGVSGDPDDDAHQPHTVKIDQVAPVLENSFTGQEWDSDAEDIDVDAGNNRVLRVEFDDAVTGVDSSDFEVELESGTTLIPTSVQVFEHDNVSSVFLTLGSAIPSDDLPTVTIVGQVNDAAGNSQTAGSDIAEDHLAPVVTVALSGGSGTGSGSSGPTGLTNGTMVITITVDELLSGSPNVDIFDADGAEEVSNVTAINQGNNVYRATFSGAPSDGDKAVRVVVNDASATGSNERTAGGTDVAADSAIGFNLDSTDPALDDDDVTTSQRKPFVVIAFDDAHTVTVNTARVGGTNVLSDLATTDNKKFFYVPADDLALGNLTVEGRATDLAGNQSDLESFTLTIAERAAFSLDLFAGWNAKSLPSNPIDPDITSVFTNTAVDQVVAYNAMDTASPWRIATRDAVSGSWTSSTSTPLNSIRTGNGYWIHTNNFAPQEVELEGEVSPGGGSPPPLATIPTARGWNFIGVVSQNRDQTTGSSSPAVPLDRNGDVLGGEVTVADYFGTVNQGRVYRYDPSALRFEELDGTTDTVNIGEALWVFISPQNDGSFPAIVP